MYKAAEKMHRRAIKIKVSTLLWDFFRDLDIFYRNKFCYLTIGRVGHLIFNLHLTYHHDVICRISQDLPKIPIFRESEFFSLKLFVNHIMCDKIWTLGMD